MNTISELINRHDEERARAMFEAMIANFTKNFRPNDPYEAEQFDRQLFSIVRQIYADAQAPLLEMISKVAMHAPIMLVDHAHDPNASAQRADHRE